MTCVPILKLVSHDFPTSFYPSRFSDMKEFVDISYLTEISLQLATNIKMVRADKRYFIIDQQIVRYSV